jgi:1-acyl-sn-glycerol-3-phosphate acyltransferase
LSGYNRNPKPAQSRGLVIRIREAICFHSVLALFGLMCLAWSLPAAAFGRLIPIAHRARVGQFAIMTGFRIYLWVMGVTRLAVFDLGALDALTYAGPLVIVSNHRSLLDAVLVISRLPRIVCITKASLWDNWFLGGGIRLAAYIRNDAPLPLIRAAGRALHHDQQLLIFPEGTRSASGGLAPFKAGFALMAKAGNAPVQTVIIESNSQFLGKGWGLFRQPSFPLIYRARLGRRFDIGHDVGQASVDIESYFRDELDGACA